MSYLIRSVFKRFSCRSVAFSYLVDRNALLARNSLVTSWSTSSRLTGRDYHKPNDKKNFTDLMSGLDDSMVKRGLVHLDDLNAILKKLAVKQTLSSISAKKLILCCGVLLAHESPFARIQLVHQMWDSFKEYGVKYGIDHYNALLKVYSENNYPFNPDEIMKDLRAERIAPNADTYQYFIAKYSQKGDLVNVNRILLLMREKNLPVKVDVYRSLVVCHSINDSMDDADNITSIVAKMDHEALSAVYATLIVEYIRKGNVDKALNIFDTALMKHKYKLNEYFDVLVELAAHDHEAEFHRELQDFKHPTNYNYKVPIYITKLIALGKTRYAYAVLQTMHQVTRKVGGTKVAMNPFFISNLVRYDVPCNEIRDICMEMKETKVNNLAFEVAMHESLRMKKEKLALNLFQIAKSINLPIRLHYFWPLLLNRARNNDTDGVFHLLKIMSNEYGLVANSETLRFYVIPFVYSKTMDLTSFMFKFKPYGISISSLVTSIVHHLLMERDIQKAAEVAESYGASYPVHRYGKITVDLFVETKDCNSFVKLMKAYFMGSLWQVNHKGVQQKAETDSFDHGNIFGLMVSNAVEKLMKEKDGPEQVEKLFKCMLENNITIPSKKFQLIRKILFDNGQLHDERIASILEKLKSERDAIEPAFGSKVDVTQSEEHVERQYRKMEAGAAQSDLSKRYLFSFYAKNNNLEKLLELKKRFETENYKLNSGMYSQVVNILVEHGKWEDALMIYREQQKIDETFALDNLKLNRLALALVQNGRIQDARELLSESKFLKLENPRRLAEATRTYSNILKYFVTKHDVESVEYFFKIFEVREFGIVSEEMLESLVRVHLLRNDLSSALKRYSQCVSEYKQSPCRDDLMRALAMHGDKDKLGEFISISSFSRGEGETLYDLVIVYSELNMIEEAKKILQSRALKLSRAGSKRLQTVYEQYCENGDAKKLFNLFLVTRGTKLLERDELALDTLTACINSNDVKSAQALWTEMQEEDIAPSSNFLNSLAKLLKKNGIPVNFDYFEETEVDRSGSKFSRNSR